VNNSIKIIVTDKETYEYSLDDEFGFTKNPIISTTSKLKGHDAFESCKDKMDVVQCKRCHLGLPKFLRLMATDFH
jgi:hypothetical protein